MNTVTVSPKFQVVIPKAWFRFVSIPACLTGLCRYRPFNCRVGPFSIGELRYRLKVSAADRRG